MLGMKIILEKADMVGQGHGLMDIKKCNSYSNYANK